MLLSARNGGRLPTTVGIIVPLGGLLNPARLKSIATAAPAHERLAVAGHPDLSVAAALPAQFVTHRFPAFRRAAVRAYCC